MGRSRSLHSPRQRFAALGADVRLATWVRARGAEAASDADEAAQGEQAAGEQPEERGVDDGVDGEAGPERTKRWGGRASDE